MIQKIKIALPYVASIIIALVFLSSLPFKFTGAPETQVIFGALDAWAGTFGLIGLFATTGFFGAYAVGTVELIASLLLLIAFIPKMRHLQKYGAILAFFVMTGAIFFHVFTPLGIDPNNDGGGLFMMAVVSWLCALYLLYLSRAALFKV